MRAFSCGLLLIAAGLPAVTPVDTAKRTRAELEAGLKALEAKHRSEKNPAQPVAPKEEGAPAEKPKGKGAGADLVIKPDELKRARGELLRLNGYRFLCGLEAEVKLKDEFTLTCKYGAYLCSVLGHIEHTPPKPAGMEETLFRKGYEGTSHANLFSTSGPDGLTGSVDGYMDDSDEKNVGGVGHRRWCLNPAMGATGFGQVRGFSAMWSMDGSNATVTNDQLVCFPAAGFWPLAYYRARTAWSISAEPGALPVRRQGGPEGLPPGGLGSLPRGRERLEGTQGYRCACFPGRHGYAAVPDFPAGGPAAARDARRGGRPAQRLDGPEPRVRGRVLLRPFTPRARPR
ncbi:hypothetical protein EMGBD4_01540 [Verrucomicrobiota bacterium]|nr:hypothetical protein EMGBD4_01540 [Verrucomicrobiota bacterium]